MRITDYTDNLGRLQSELLKDKPISNEEQEALLRHYYDTKDLKIREKIFKANSRLIFMVINEYTGLQGYQKEELFGIASLALLKAIDAFNPEAGWKFSTFGKRCIINAFSDETKLRYNLIRPKKKDFDRMIDGSQPNYTYVSTNTPVMGDAELKIEDTLFNDDPLFDEAIDKLTEQEKIDLFWQVIKEAGLKKDYYDIAVATWSANTITGEPIKIGTEDIANMFGISSQAILNKKKNIIHQLKKNYKLRMYYKNGMFK